MVSYRAVLRAAGAGIAGVFIRTFFIQETVIMGLLEGVKVALGFVPAGLDAVLQVSDREGVYEVALTLECPMTFASRAPEKYKLRLEKIGLKLKAHFLPKCFKIMLN